MMQIHVASRILAVAAVVLFAGQAQAERLIAFVVGNSKYEKAEPLPNAERDAAAVADRMRELGFEVTEVLDGNAFSLNRAATQFISQAKGADLALFYFAGHGIQLFDRNFLLARDVDPARIDKVEGLGLDLANFMSALRSSGVVRQALLIDACRNNPFSFEETVRLLDLVRKSRSGGGGAAPAQGATRGLARVILTEQRTTTQARGAETLLFFAAQPGQVSFDGDGQHSSFVEGLKEKLTGNGRPLTEIFREVSGYVRTVTGDEQIPQVVSDWTGDVVLGRSAVTRVKYEVSEFGAPLSGADRDFVIKHTSYYDGPLQGDFIALAGTRKWGHTVAGESKRALDMGVVDGFTITFDLDRDGRDEELTVSWKSFGYRLALSTQGVSGGFDNCLSGSYPQKIQVGLRDINGDRRPEIWIAYQDEESHRGVFCILEFVGAPGLSDERRRAVHGETWFGLTAFRTLLRAEGGDITVANDNSIRICRNGRCQLLAHYVYDNGKFRAEVESLDAPAGSDLPFAHEGERTANTFAALSRRKGPILQAGGWQTALVDARSVSARARVGERTELWYRCNRYANQQSEYLEIRDLTPDRVREISIAAGLAYRETAEHAPMLLDGKACGPVDVVRYEKDSTRLFIGRTCLAGLDRAKVVTLPLLYEHDLLQIRLDDASGELSSARAICEGKAAADTKVKPQAEPVTPVPAQRTR